MQGGTPSSACRVVSGVDLNSRVSAVVLAALSLWPASAATAQTGQRSLLRQLYGDLAIEARTRGQGSLTVGAADARTSLAITLMATDLRRWSDSATRILSARPRRRADTTKWEASVTGPGVVAGSLSLSRTIDGSDTTIILLVTDTAFMAVRTKLRASEARSFAAAMKRAASASLPTRVRPPPDAMGLRWGQTPVRWGQIPVMGSDTSFDPGDFPRAALPPSTQVSDPKPAAGV